MSSSAAAREPWLSFDLDFDESFSSNCDGNFVAQKTALITITLTINLFNEGGTIVQFLVDTNLVLCTQVHAISKLNKACVLTIIYSH